MKYLILPLLALSFLAGSQNLDARCRQPDQGPPGPLLTNYIGLNSDPLAFDGQFLATIEPTPVEFPIILSGPVGITPGGTNNTDFTVEDDGVYLICWSINAYSNAPAFGGELFPEGTPAFVELDLLVNGSSATPANVQSIQSFTPIDPNQSINGFSLVNLSGQVKLELTAGDVIQLDAIAFYEPDYGISVILFSKLFNIVRIADLP